MAETDNRFVLITGLSGAGKSQALRFLEDLGYYCVDNLPPALIPKIAELVMTPDSPYKRVAVCVDARTGNDLKHLGGYLDTLTEMGVRPDTIFLDSSDKVLCQRYSESRRRHPSSPTGSIEEGIRRERELLSPIRARADLFLDTSAISVAELRDRLADAVLGDQEARKLVVTIISFGFRFGVPQEADLVLDVRFLPNPHYVAELRAWSGNEPEVRDYVLNNDDARTFLTQVQGLLEFLIPRYENEPKSYLTIGVGCTGGRHRSVAVAHALSQFLQELRYAPRLRHRDVARTVEGGA